MFYSNVKHPWMNMDNDGEGKGYKIKGQSKIKSKAHISVSSQLWESLRTGFEALDIRN